MADSVATRRYTRPVSTGPTRNSASRKLWAGLALAAVLPSCEPVLSVGDVVCPPSEGGAPGFDARGVFRACVVTAGSGGSGGTTDGGSAGASGAPPEAGSAGADSEEVCPEGGASGVTADTLLPVPWQTSFDAGFCNYDDGGYCYADGDSSYRLVTSPVHSGKQAAAFDMRSSTSKDERQTRCVRQGIMPVEAYYGAWYYVPSELSGAHDWNLFHFRGGQFRMFPHGLWDVSMNDDAGDGYSLFIYDALHDGHYGQVDSNPIPRERWFHIEFYWKRATDTTGEVALFQDGQEIVRRTGIVTDDDSPFGEWYVGNYTALLEAVPADITVYVDDVTVRLP